MATENALSNSSSIFDVEKIMAASIPVARGLTDDLLGWRQAFLELDSETALPVIKPRQLQFDEVGPALDDWLSHERDRNRSNKYEPIENATLIAVKADAAPRTSYFEPMQEWEGYVVSLNEKEKTFYARLVDKTAFERHESEEATFSFDDVSESDKELLIEGAIFRWSLGYEKNASGTRRKISSVVFRRVPIWTRLELEESRNRAREIIRSITWE